MNIMRLHIALLLLILVPLCMSAQSISGHITDEQGQPMPYVSIFIKKTSTGTVTNDDGHYILPLSAGTYEVSYRYVGYQTTTKTVTLLQNQELAIDVQLQPQSTELSEVLIAADREDPAYEIIRRAISRRKKYLAAMPAYQCNVYVKGNQKILKAPERIMGQEIGDLDGMLDSTRSGIIYLSESVSELHADGKKRKEVIKSSKISGNPQGYSFNSAKEMEMNFYQNTIELQRQMVTPIANNALNYYRYRLIGTFTSDGRIVNQIKVWPKRDTDPAFSGMIYITDELYNIHSLRLGATSEATQIFFIDTIHFSQVYVPIQDNIWALFSNTISFDAGLLGFEIAGEFGAVYSDYQINPDRPDDFFDQYTHVVLPESNERDSAYWQEIRPVPLTVEEISDYDKKDSVYTLRNDPVYMDSVDRVSSSWSIGSLIGGYSYQRRSKGLYIDLSSPFSDLNFNTVQGLNSKLSIDVRKYFDKDETQRLLGGAAINFGLAEKQLRGTGYIVYRPHRMSPLQYSLRGGRKAVQVNGANPISARWNSLYSLLAERNYAKYLDLSYLTAGYTNELMPGLRLSSSISWEERSALQNHTDFSFVKKDVNEYTPNSDVGRLAPYTFDTHQALLLDLNFRIRFGQKYMLRPDRKFDMGYSGPTINVQYSGAYTALGGDVGFHKLAIGITDEINTGVTGRMSYYLNAGKFFRQKNMNLRDYRHFNTNETLFIEDQDYSRTFLLLPYYSHSTSEHYLQAHVEHHFDGFLLGKIPLLRELGWHIVAGAKYLKTKEHPSYAEFHMGIDNVGYRLFRLLRVDAVLALQNDEHRWGARISLGF